MDWVSFDDIKRRVSLQMAIERYGITLRKINASTLRGRCPLPTHRSEKSSESFTVALAKGTGGAWACQSQSCVKARGRVGGNVLDFVAAMEQCSIRDAAMKLQTWFGEASPEGTHTDGKEPQHENAAREKSREADMPALTNREGDQPVSNKPLSFELQHIDYHHPYLSERGVTEETAKRFGVGIFPGRGSMSGRCVLPIHNAEGALVAYAGRAIDNAEPRYKFPAGFHKSLELFNLHRVMGEMSIVVVEGFFDCMKVTEAGFPCVALMGSAMSNTQERLLGHFAHVIVMLDGDEAGRNGAEDIADRLKRSVFQIDVIDLPDGVQPDRMSASDLRNLLREFYH